MRTVLVFVDESGDPGFNVQKGSSPVFVVAMAIFYSPEDAQTTEDVISQCAATLRPRPEFKFNKCADVVRDGFFESVKECPFAVRAIVIIKNRIHSAHLRSDKEDFYRYFVRQMMTHDNGTLDRAKVIIDGSGDRAFRQMLKTSLRRQLGKRTKDVVFRNSKNEPLVQLADMCAGAIARSRRADRSDRWRWFNKLRPRIDDVWDFR